MSAAQLPGIEVSQQPDGSVRYRLPRHDALCPQLLSVGGLWVVLLVPVCIPLFFVPPQQLPVVLRAGFIVLVVIVGIGLWLLWSELRTVMDPSEVLVSKDGLRTAVRVLGPFRWTLRRSLVQVECLVLNVDSLRETELWAICYERSPLRLARLLPYDRLEPLARDLAGQISRLDPERESALEVREERTGSLVRPSAQPARSRIVVAEQDGGVLFTVPPIGFHGEVLLLLGAGGIFLLAPVVGLLITLLPVLTSGGAAPVLSLKSIHDVVTGFLQPWLIGLGWVALGLNRANRRVVLNSLCAAAHKEFSVA